MSINIDLNLLKTLSQLGLSEKESLVYIGLLEGGEMSAIKLSRGTELHRQFVYNSLSTLKEKGLVLQISTAPAKWRAQNPRKLIALAEERQKLAVEASENLIALAHQRVGQEFAITEGKKAFQDRIMATIKRLPRDSVVRMICGEWSKYFDLAGEMVHAEWDRIRISKGISFRIIGPESLKHAMSHATSTRALTEYHTLAGLDKNLVNTVIYEDSVDFDIYGDPHLTFSIKNADVAESQRHFFDTLWQAQSR
ncbi:MAG: hypothetical protein A3C12_01140 [Candidatus Sungbacteria bacterium RIFCSPHIGHO2_02_FULL_49_20]|uniref:Transcription regulator TrmB N-terminal domain-containing protein n=1 Tax=Candidatus Sungbacteria bacterium RIFCSPHIGHO2_02_FULL_49_20 TaxID=1802272 RepID=A0A1G2KRW5_9BACT|nr:MAG: hypothetical protein A3C12_01140 [Candidatus Sungbacteria bacterium RIFCSPHIGHO2_02_FULL_49_20]